jgi:hypothetical protein
VVVLDEACGDYVGLGPHESAIWRRLVNGERGDVLVAGDEVDRFIEVIAARGWLGSASADPIHRSRPARAPTWRRAVLCLSLAGLLLRVRGFRAAYAWARGAVRTEPSGDARALGHALRTFSQAEHGFVPRADLADCLPRSLALFVFLAGAGLAPRHRIGVKRYPFSAHAWVEVEGDPVLCAAAPCALFTPIATLPD